MQLRFSENNREYKMNIRHIRNIKHRVIRPLVGRWSILLSIKLSKDAIPIYHLEIKFLSSFYSFYT